MINLQTKPFEMKDLTLFECEDPDIWSKMEFNLSRAESNFVSVISPIGQVVSVIGMKYIRTGVAEVGIFRSPALEKRKLDFARFMKWMVDEYIVQNYKIHRLEIYCDKDWSMGHRWASFLGFQFEGVCRAYGEDLKDYNQFSRIYPKGEIWRQAHS